MCDFFSDLRVSGGDDFLSWFLRASGGIGEFFSDMRASVGMALSYIGGGDVRSGETERRSRGDYREPRTQCGARRIPI